MTQRRRTKCKGDRGLPLRPYLLVSLLKGSRHHFGNTYVLTSARLEVVSSDIHFPHEVLSLIRRYLSLTDVTIFGAAQVYFISNNRDGHV